MELMTATAHPDTIDRLERHLDYRGRDSVTKSGGKVPPKLDGVLLAEIAEAPERSSSIRSTRRSWDENAVRSRDHGLTPRLNGFRTNVLDFQQGSCSAGSAFARRPWVRLFWGWSAGPSDTGAG